MSLDLREQDPAALRFNAVSQAVVFTLIGAVVGIVAAEIVTGTSDPVGWAVIVGCTAAGAVPLVRWLLQRRHDHLDLYGIDRRLRPLLVRAAESVMLIEEAASAAPDGPVAVQLHENHLTALSHLKLMESDARRSAAASRQGLLQLCHQLDQLALASQRLSSTALTALPSVLGSLTERTQLVERALSEELDGPGPVDHGATNAH